jgi:hypothetical protein
MFTSQALTHPNRRSRLERLKALRRKAGLARCTLASLAASETRAISKFNLDFINKEI